MEASDVTDQKPAPNQPEFQYSTFVQVARVCIYVLLNEMQFDHPHDAHRTFRKAIKWLERSILEIEHDFNYYDKLHKGEVSK